MTITVDTPDGGKAEFPDGTSTDTISSAMKAKFGGPAQTDESAAGIVGNTLYRAANTGTLGAVDLGLAGLHAAERGTGYDPNATDLSQIQAQGEVFAGQHPLLSLGADVAGYGLGFGKLGIAAKLAKGAEGLGAGARTAQALGSAGEAGAATAGADVLRGETPGTDVLINAGVGGALGAAISNRGRALGPALGRAAGKVGTAADDTGVLGPVAKDFLGPEKPPPKAVGEDILQANKDAAYRTLETTPVKAPTVGSALQRAVGSLTPGERAGLSDTMQKRIDQISDIIDNSPKLSLGDVHSFGTTIGSGVRSPADTIVGARIAEAFNGLDPNGLMADARLKFGQLKDTQTLKAGLDASKWYKGANAADTISTAAERTAPDARTTFSPAGREAMEALGKTGPGTFGKMADAVLAKGANRAVAGGIGALGGGALGHEAIGALIGASNVGPGGIGGWMARMRTNAKARRAMKAALAATSSGLPATAEMYRGAPWLSQAVRQAVYARGASGEGS